MNDAQAFDLIVIGAGSGGVRCARIAAKLGARVACIEERFWGGTCVNVGCVPKKIYVMGSEFSTLFERARGFGWETVNSRHDWSNLQATMTLEVTRLSGIYDNLLGNAGVTRYWGHARLLDAHRVAVGDTVMTAPHIVIATGSKPSLPTFPGVEHVHSSDGFFSMTALPRRSVVIGGGYIAVELAGILAAAGSQTTLVYRGDMILRGFDQEVRAHTQHCLEQRGIRVLVQTDVREVRRHDGQTIVVTTRDEKIEADRIFAATGRTPNIAGLGLEALGIALNEKGGIAVDEHYQSTVPGVYAVGDVLHRVQLTPVALAEGMYVANHLFGGSPQAIDYHKIATAVFSQPQIGTVGMTEEQCRRRGQAFRVYRSRFTPMSHAFSARPEKVLLKILVDVATDEVLGIHMVGEHAGEIIQGFAAAITCGVTKRQLDSTIGIHPTVAEELVTLRDAAETIIP